MLRHVHSPLLRFATIECARLPIPSFNLCSVLVQLIIIFFAEDGVGEGDLFARGCVVLDLIRLQVPVPLQVEPLVDVDLDVDLTIVKGVLDIRLIFLPLLVSNYTVFDAGHITMLPCHHKLFQVQLVSPCHLGSAGAS